MVVELEGKGGYPLSTFGSEHVPGSAQVGKLDIDGSGTNQHVAGLVNKTTGAAWVSTPASVCGAFRLDCMHAARLGKNAGKWARKVGR